MPDNPKIKPVKAWGIVFEKHGLATRTTASREFARFWASQNVGAKVVRVRITVVQSKKRGKKVKYAGPKPGGNYYPKVSR